jgi:deazaflavin-dependent oxidoreductase (nitroreductase family)
MPNPFNRSKIFHKIGHVTNTASWRLIPTPTGLAVITTSGRKTGKRRVRALRAVRAGSVVYAVALLGERTDWLHNIRARSEVRIKLGRRTYAATARELYDPSDRARAAAAYRPIAGWFDYVDYANFVWGVPTRRKLLRAHDEWFEQGTPVEFRIEGHC